MRKIKNILHPRNNFFMKNVLKVKFSWKSLRSLYLYPYVCLKFFLEHDFSALLFLWKIIGTEHFALKIFNGWTEMIGNKYLESLDCFVRPLLALGLLQQNYVRILLENLAEVALLQSFMDCCNCCNHSISHLDSGPQSGHIPANQLPRSWLRVLCGRLCRLVALRLRWFGSFSEDREHFLLILLKHEISYLSVGVGESGWQLGKTTTE